MDKQELTQLLQQVADGDVTPDDAALRLKMQPFQEIGAYAKVDFHRGIRQGVPEVIFGEGKAKEHILGIAREMLRSGQRTILITRLSAEAAAYLETDLPLHYDSAARVGIIGALPAPGGKGPHIILCKSKLSLWLRYFPAKKLSSFYPLVNNDVNIFKSGKH